MAKRRGRSNYKQIKTGTVDLGNTGAQTHIAEIRMIDDALRGSFLNNVQFSVMDNGSRPASDLSQVPGFLPGAMTPLSHPILLLLLVGMVISSASELSKPMRLVLLLLSRSGQFMSGSREPMFSEHSLLVSL